jgi:hypothetical protein
MTTVSDQSGDRINSICKYNCFYFIFRQLHVSNRRINMPRARQNHPKLPDSMIVEKEMQGAYRRIRFTPNQKHMSISTFFDEVTPLLEETADLISHEQYDVKVCSHLEVEMIHKVGDVERVEMIHFILKAIPLADMILTNLPSEYEERLSQFVSRGSHFRLKEVAYLDWVVVQYNMTPFKIGH